MYILLSSLRSYTICILRFCDRSRSDRDASIYRRSSTSDRPISRDSSSHESNPSPAVIKSSLDRDRSRSPVSRNRPDSTVKLLGTSNRQNTEYEQPVPSGGFGGSRGPGAVDRRDDSGSPLPPTVLVDRECEKLPPGMRTGNPESPRDFYRGRDPMAMVDPVLVGLYSGLAGLTGQSFLGPFGIYGGVGGGVGRGTQDAERREAGESTMHGCESPVNRTGKMDSGGSSVKGERSDVKKRKEHKKCSPSKKHESVDALGGRLFHTPPDCSSISTIIDRGTKTALTTMDDGEPNPKGGNHSPSSTVETSSASTPSVDAKTTGNNNNNNNNNAILNPLLPPYPTEVEPGCSAASSGNVTPDSSSCDPQQQQLLQPQMEKSVMEVEGSTGTVHTVVVSQQLQEEC